jgi:hypothetical protein
MRTQVTFSLDAIGPAPAAVTTAFGRDVSPLSCCTV